MLISREEIARQRLQPTITDIITTVGNTQGVITIRLTVAQDYRHPLSVIHLIAQILKEQGFQVLGINGIMITIKRGV